MNGFVGVDPATQVEGFARAPYPLALDLSVDGVRLSDLAERSTLREQRYDFATGELTTELTFAALERTAEVRIVQFCSRTFPTVCAQQIDVHVDGPCALELSVGIDPDGIPGSWSKRVVRPGGSADGLLLWSGHGALSTCGAAYASELAGAEAEPRHDTGETRPLQTTYVCPGALSQALPRAAADKPRPATRPSAARPPGGAAAPCARPRAGFDRVRDANRRAWGELWRARPVLVGAPERWQALVDAAFFYLHTSAHPSSPCSTSMFGLAYWPDYHYYRGHVMWDIETFAVPPLLLTDPDAARALLGYRIDRLEGAQQNAAANGYRGAQYPWESSPLTGHEAAPGDGEAAAYEHHVSLDVAYALVQYLHATGDLEFGRERVKPVLDQVCRWLESRVTKTPRGYEILGANGVAEKKQPVDNNAFVNMAASVVLRETLALAPDLGLEPRPALGGDPTRPVRARRPAHERDQESRPLPARRGEGSDPRGARRALPLHLRGIARGRAGELRLLPRSRGATTWGPRCSPRSWRPTPPGSDVGEQALELLETGYAAFVLQPFSITAEYDPRVFPEQEVAGPFTANIGAFLMTCLYGFTGIQLGAGNPRTMVLAVPFISQAAGRASRSSGSGSAAGKPPSRRGMARTPS